MGMVRLYDKHSYIIFATSLAKPLRQDFCAEQDFFYFSWHLFVNYTASKPAAATCNFVVSQPLAV